MEPTFPGTDQPRGLDLDPSRRPGVPRERAPEPWPHTRYPPTRQQSLSSVPKHGRPGKPMPPVYGTAVPPRGAAGAIRKLAYQYPDHFMRHWMLLLFADRVDSWGLRTRRVLRALLPAAGAVLLTTRALSARR